MGAKKVLGGALGPATLGAVAVLLCLPGLSAAISHPDQMAFQPLFHPDKTPFNPGWFEKPPFHTYFNYFLSVAPINMMGLSPEIAAKWQVSWSKFLQVLLFAASVLVLHQIVRRIIQPGPAFAIAAIFATSAGMVAHAHFLTADIAVTFWMLLTFSFCQRLFERGRLHDYAAAGILTGLATATKYNGLGVGIAIPLAHWVRNRSVQPDTNLLRSLLSRKLMVALALVALGFIIGNPFSILDFRTFLSDFYYNWTVAPVYEGQTGHSFLQFFVAISETVGIPVSVLGSAAGVWAVYKSFRPGMNQMQRTTVWMSAAVLVLYYAKFAPFPRLENRFILPIAPYLLIVAAQALDVAAARAKPAMISIVASLIAYNIACVTHVWPRFLEDPRVKAKTYLTATIPIGSTVEADIYSTGLGPQRPSCETEMPFLTGRERLFAKLFSGDERITGPPSALARSEHNVTWFTREALAMRSPDFLIMNSNYYGRFLRPGLQSELYPSVKDYYLDLLAGQLGYKVVVDLHPPRIPEWTYPRTIDFLDNRLVVLQADETNVDKPRRRLNCEV